MLVTLDHWSSNMRLRHGVWWNGFVISITYRVAEIRTGSTGFCNRPNSMADVLRRS